MTRLVYPDPAPVVVVCTRLAPTNRSFAFFVVTKNRCCLDVLLPCAPATTSTGAAGAIPLYSAMRISG